MDEPRYDVFLSYNKCDAPAVAELAERLRARGVEPWLDRINLPKGEDWIQEAEKCLSEKCRCCAVLIGPSGLGPWQTREMRLALDRQVEAELSNERFPVIPIILPGGTAESISPFLKRHTWISFSKTLSDENAFAELVQAIPGSSSRFASSTDAECPYRGLEFFDIAHASAFFGREQLILRLIERLRTSRQSTFPNRFLAIVGASGSGKSSLARAGLVAALQRGVVEGSEQWQYVICRPGSDPCASLAVQLAKGDVLGADKFSAMTHLKQRMLEDPRALQECALLIMESGGPEQRLVILVDQFEEIFTICHDELLRKAFIDNLTFACQIAQGQTVVLLAMRADFYEKCANYPELARALSESQELIGPMTAEELRKAIDAPAHKVGCELEPGLSELLLNEVVHEPGSLPFLQFALRELWNRRNGRRLTMDAYRTIGGVAGALQRKADEVYSRLTEKQQQICRHLFLRLTQPGEGTEDTKRRVPLSELQPKDGAIEEVDAVLRDLTQPDARLVVGAAEDGTQFVEVAHEALIRGWPTLRSWVDSDRAALRVQRRLTEAGTQWRDNGRDSSFLYHGARLVIAEDWAAVHADQINPLESEFIRTSRWFVRRQHLLAGAAAAAILCSIAVGWVAVRARSIQQQNAIRAAALVQQLLAVDSTEVPTTVQQLAPLRHWADPLIRQEDSKAEPGSRAKLNLSLALLPVDKTKVPQLGAQLPFLSPRDFVEVRNSLVPYSKNKAFAEEVVDPLWQLALDLKPQQDVQQRFQAACALATYASSDKTRWDQIRTFVATRLTLDASALVAWRAVLYPAREHLVVPLSDIYRDTQSNAQYRRSYAADTLAQYLADRPDQLFDLLADAEPFQFPIIFAALQAHKDAATILAHNELNKTLPEAANDTEKDKLAKRQANSAAALVRLGTPDQVWPCLKFSADPSLRSYIIDWLSPLGCDPKAIAERLDDEPDVTIRRALVLALGEFSEQQLPSAQRARLVNNLLTLYENDPDSGLHGAVEWLLRKWGRAIAVEAAIERIKSDEQHLQAQMKDNTRQWYVNMEKQTFAIVDASTESFETGSPKTERGRFTNEISVQGPHGWRFAISTHEITKAQYQTFQTAEQEDDLMAMPRLSEYVLTDDSPQVSMTWYQAAHYCNWLSKEMGIDEKQWCYEPNKEGKYAAGMNAKPRFWELIGYRLSTEAEWEYACRAGHIKTSRYYGGTEGLLPKYAWYQANAKNRTWPIGSLKPNDFGLFDMLGNVWEWNFDQYVDYHDQRDHSIEEIPNSPTIENTNRRVLRGGAFTDQIELLRAASRDPYRPDGHNFDVGFRPVRTCRTLD